MESIKRWFRPANPEEAIGIFFACLIWIGIIFGLTSVAFGASPVYRESFMPDLNDGVGPFTDSIELTCHDDLVLIVAVYLDTDRIVNSLYYDGEAMTRLFSSWRDENSNAIEYWILVNPTCGTAEDLVLTQSSSGSVRTYVATYSGVNQIDPVDTFAFQTRVSGTADVEVMMTNTESDDTIVFFVAGSGTLTDDNADVRLLDTRAGTDRWEIADRTVSGNGAFTTIFNDGNTFGMFAGGVALIGVSSSSPATPSATTTVATSTIEFVSEFAFRTLLLFWFAFIIGLWIFHLFMPR